MTNRVKRILKRGLGVHVLFFLFLSPINPPPLSPPPVVLPYMILHANIFMDFNLEIIFGGKSQNIFP